MGRTFFSFEPIIWLDLETCGLDKFTKDIWQFAYMIETKEGIKEPRNLFIRPVNPLYCSSCKTLLNGDTYPYTEWLNKECPVCHSSKVVENIDPGARAIFKTPYEEIVNNGMNPKEAYAIFRKDMEQYTYRDKYGKDRQMQMYPAGYCVDFDLGFLAEWFRKVGDYPDKNEIHQWFVMAGMLDTRAAMVQLYKRLVKRGIRVPPIENFKLGTAHAFMKELTGKTLELEKTASATFHDAAYDIAITRMIQQEIDNLS